MHDWTMADRTDEDGHSTDARTTLYAARRDRPLACYPSVESRALIRRPSRSLFLENRECE